MAAIPKLPAGESGLRSFTSIAVDSIRTDIVRCALKPGEKLRIQSLCERYRTNASAIREALSRLVTDELVEAVDQRGFRVSQVSRDDLLDLTQARIGVESLALATAIELGDAEWESQVIAAYHRLSKSVPPGSKASGNSQGDWETLHRQFHEVLLSGCRSRWLLSICRALYEKSERYRLLAQNYTKPTQRDALAEHRELMEAALARNATLVRSQLAQHFTITTEIILRGIYGTEKTSRQKVSTRGNNSSTDLAQKPKRRGNGRSV